MVWDILKDTPSWWHSRYKRKSLASRGWNNNGSNNSFGTPFVSDQQIVQLPHCNFIYRTKAEGQQKLKSKYTAWHPVYYELDTNKLPRQRSNRIFRKVLNWIENQSPLSSDNTCWNAALFNPFHRTTKLLLPTASLILSPRYIVVYLFNLKVFNGRTKQEVRTNWLRSKQTFT